MLVRSEHAAVGAVRPGLTESVCRARAPVFADVVRRPASVATRRAQAEPFGDLAREARQGEARRAHGTFARAHVTPGLALERVAAEMPGGAIVGGRPRCRLRHGRSRSRRRRGSIEHRNHTPGTQPPRRSALRGRSRGGNSRGRRWMDRAGCSSSLSRRSRPRWHSASCTPHGCTSAAPGTDCRRCSLHRARRSRRRAGSTRRCRARPGPGRWCRDHSRNRSLDRTPHRSWAHTGSAHIRGPRKRAPVRSRHTVRPPRSLSRPGRTSAGMHRSCRRKGPAGSRTRSSRARASSPCDGARGLAAAAATGARTK